MNDNLRFCLNPFTSSSNLHEVSRYKGEGKYWVHHALAMNPNTSIFTLLRLYSKYVERCTSIIQLIKVHPNWIEDEHIKNTLHSF